MENKNIFLLNEIVNKRKITDLSSSSDTRLLLEYKNPEDVKKYELLKTIGLTNKLDADKKLFDKENKLNKLTDIYKRRAYKGSEIFKLCMKYDLKLIRGDQFLGEIPLSFADEVNYFISQNRYDDVDHNGNIINKSNVNTNQNQYFVLCTENKPISQTISLFYTEDDSHYTNWENLIDRTYFEITSTGKPFNTIIRYIMGIAPLIEVRLYLLVLLPILLLGSYFGAITSLISLVLGVGTYLNYKPKWQDRYKRKITNDL